MHARAAKRRGRRAASINDILSYEDGESSSCERELCLLTLFFVRFYRSTASDAARDTYDLSATFLVNVNSTLLRFNRTPTYIV